MMTSGAFCKSILTIACLWAVSSVVQADKVYKWTTKDGRTVYQDHAPNSENDNGHDVLSNRGMVVEKIKSREARAAQRRADAAAKLVADRDRSLLATFTTEEDLLRTRADRLGMVDGLVTRLNDRVTILSERRKRLEVRIAKLIALNGIAPKSLLQERQSISRNIENTQSLINAQGRERKTIEGKFDADLIRISVPTPWSVNSSNSTACSTRPSII